MEEEEENNYDIRAKSSYENHEQQQHQQQQHPAYQSVFANSLSRQLSNNSEVVNGNNRLHRDFDTTNGDYYINEQR